jgi:N-acetylmuramoyl-L-alanine amidase
MRVALAAGHHNSTGGNAAEKVNTALTTAATATELRRRGVDVRVITPVSGSVSAVGRQVVDWAAQGWPADYFIEFHTEAGPRGVFGIYPDSPATGDVDADAKRLVADLAQRISWATGLPLRGDGTMSEQQTGVGQGGSRLGVFAATAPLKANLTRFLLEVGAHTQPADQAILDKPETPGRVAKAVADGLLGQETPPAPTYNVGPGVAAALARQGDTPIGDEIYYVNGMSMTPGTKGIYIYIAQADTVYRAPKA